MQNCNDPDYYAARLRAERDAAAAATCEEARASHLQLALRYQQLLDAVGRPRLVADASDQAAIDVDAPIRARAAR